MGRYRMGNTSRGNSTGDTADSAVRQRQSYPRPQNLDEIRVEGVARGPYKPFPFDVGTKFGELTVLRWEQRPVTHGKRINRSAGYEPICRCSCGYEGFFTRQNLKMGYTTRCHNCGKLAAAAKRYAKYKAVMPNDFHRNRLLNRLSAAITRCTKETDSHFAHYGGRNIGVHPEWREDRSKFLAYIQTLPGWDDPSLEIDRIDNQQGYIPGNLQFVTRYSNSKNRRTIKGLQAELYKLMAERDDLRSRLLRAEKQICNCNCKRTDDCT